MRIIRVIRAVLRLPIQQECESTPAQIKTAPPGYPLPPLRTSPCRPRLAPNKQGLLDHVRVFQTGSLQGRSKGRNPRELKSARFFSFYAERPATSAASARPPKQMIL